MPVAYKNIARVARPHGKAGEVVVQPVRGLPLLLREGLTVALTPPALKRDRFCTVETVNDAGGEVLVRFSGITCISDAEGVTGCWVLARADELDLGPLDAAADELIGRTVIDARYGELGIITEIMETPANDVWVVDGGAYGEVLLPVIEQVVAELPADGPLAVTVMDGLIDVPADDARGGASCA